MSDQGSPATPRTRLDDAWRELELDALASDGPIRDSDVTEAIRRHRARIEAEAREDAAAPGLREALVEWWALWDADGPESGKHRTDPLTIPGDMRERHTALLAAAPAAAADAPRETAAAPALDVAWQRDGRDIDVAKAIHATGIANCVAENCNAEFGGFSGADHDMALLFIHEYEQLRAARLSASGTTE